MNFLQFKRKFIELYNQQKFTRFNKNCVNLVLKSKFEDIEAPTLLEAICLGAEDVAELRLVTKAELDTFLGDLFSAEEFKFSFSSNEPELNPLVSANMTPSEIIEDFVIYPEAFNASQLTDGLRPEELKFKEYSQSIKLRSSPVRTVGSITTPANMPIKIDVTKADLTFFTNWAQMEFRNPLMFTVENSTPQLNSSIYYTLGEAGISAKLYDVATMRSITEYYISYYDNDTYLSDVADETLFEFVYNEI